jgi:hypothetical protein
MKPLLKLAFVALLIGVALEMPTRVKASGGQYVCTYDYQECMTGEGGCEPEMGICSENCHGQSGNQQWCYGTYSCNTPIQICDQWGMNCQPGYSCSSGETCFNGPSNSCMSECTEQINSCQSWCFSSYCYLYDGD